jgi:hypothetical protein
MLAAVGIVAAFGFVVSPQYLTAFGAPVFFVDNIRYADPAIVLGLVLLPLSRDLAGPRWRWCLLLTFAGITVLTQLDESTWPLHLLPRQFVPPVTGVDAILGAFFGVGVLIGGLALVGWRGALPWRRRGTARSIAVLVTSAAVVLVGFGVQSFYLDHRYESPSLQPPFGWAQSVSGARIGVAGTFTQVQYALYGRDLSNYVQYIGVRGPHGSYAPATSCTQWRRLVNSGHYAYVVTSTGPVSSLAAMKEKPHSYTVWTGHDRNSRLVHSNVLMSNTTEGRTYVGLSVFRLHGPLNVSACSDPVFKHVESTPA